MARKPSRSRLKVYSTHIGFHDWLVAAPSQKAALEAWDVRENLFAMGAAKVVTDQRAIELAMKTPAEPVARDEAAKTRKRQNAARARRPAAFPG